MVGKVGTIPSITQCRPALARLYLAQVTHYRQRNRKIRHKSSIKSNLSLYSLQYAEACNKLAGLISAPLRAGNTAPFEEMSQQWPTLGNTVSDLTGPRFETQTSRSRDERVSARPTGRFRHKSCFI